MLTGQKLEISNIHADLTGKSMGGKCFKNREQTVLKSLKKGRKKKKREKRPGLAPLI